jgi:hypothetical protein
MPQRNQSPYDRSPSQRRTPLDNDVDPDGMDSETEGDDDLRDDADGVVEGTSARQGRSSGTHGAAEPGTTPPRKQR